MKNILKYSIIFITYLLLGIIFWGNHDYMLPIFITLYIVINLYLIDTSKSYLLNLIQLSAISIIAFVISIFTNDVDKLLPFEYIGSMILSSMLIYFLKKNSKISPSF